MVTEPIDVDTSKSASPMGRMRMLWRVTSFRLTVIFISVFFIFSVMLVAGSLFTVTGVLHREARNIINDELALMQRAERRGGLQALARTVEARSRAPGASLYLLFDGTGQVFAGNVRRLPGALLNRTGWINEPFEYRLLEGFARRRPRQEGPPGATSAPRPDRVAIAKVVTLDRGLRLLIGRDFGQPERFRRIILFALIASTASLAIIAFGAWLFLGRKALGRIEKVSAASERIVGGDLSQRLPISGADDEFDRLAQSLNAMLARIESLDGGIKAMADSVAHDLKTPLTRLRNRAERELANADSASTADRQNALSEIVAEADHTIRIFNALLMISRVEAGSQAATLEPVDACAVLADIAELYDVVAEEAGVRIEFADDLAEAGPLMVRGNRELLGQALSNLVENALKYARPGPPPGDRPQDEQMVTNPTVISLFCERGSRHCSLVVADNGPGIPAHEYARVVQRFVRLDQSRSKPGSGLGLALVNAVAKLCGGSLELHDNEPGLRAAIRLPLTNS
ncbi:MAG: HAMP domain-containing sensor histidine kinase [Pseudomonadota bacterium]